MKELFIALVIDAVLFAVIHVAHFNLLPPDIVFRAGIIDVVLACVAGGVVTFFRVRKDAVLLTSVSLICFFAGLCYVSLIPTMVDRSITVYTLLSLYEAGDKGVLETTLRDRLRNQHIIEKRFSELEKLGIIVKDGDRFVLSEKGKLSAQVFLTDMRLLSLEKEYTLFEQSKP